MPDGVQAPPTLNWTNSRQEVSDTQVRSAVQKIYRHELPGQSVAKVVQIYHKGTYDTHLNVAVGHFKHLL